MTRARRPRARSTTKARLVDAAVGAGDAVGVARALTRTALLRTTPRWLTRAARETRRPNRPTTKPSLTRRARDAGAGGGAGWAATQTLRNHGLTIHPTQSSEFGNRAPLRSPTTSC